MRVVVVVLTLLGGALTVAAVGWLWHRNAARDTELSMRRRSYEERKHLLPDLIKKYQNKSLDDGYERMVLDDLMTFEREVLDPELGHGHYYSQRLKAEMTGPAFMGIAGIGVTTIASVLGIYA